MEETINPKRRYMAKMSYEAFGGFLITRFFASEHDDCRLFLKGSTLMIPVIKASGGDFLENLEISITDRVTKHTDFYSEDDFK